MAAKQSSHLKHVYRLAAAKQLCKLRIRTDEALILWVLQLMGADIIPHFFDYLSARELLLSDNLRQFWRESGG